MLNVCQHSINDTVLVLTGHVFDVSTVQIIFFYEANALALHLVHLNVLTVRMGS